MVSPARIVDCIESLFQDKTSIKEVVDNLPKIHLAKQSLGIHTELAKLIKQSIKEEVFTAVLDLKQQRLCWDQVIWQCSGSDNTMNTALISVVYSEMNISTLMVVTCIRTVDSGWWIQTSNSYFL